MAEPTIRKLEGIRKGDIIRIRAPFEENTFDYYNGYHPKEIRGDFYKDRFGNTSKPRFVIVAGTDGRDILYLPLTSRHSGFDDKHQYTLQDNSMTWKKSPDMKSYVECDSLRQIRAKPEWDIQCFGRIAENDMINIMVKVGKREIDFDSQRDQRVYVSRNKEEKFERTLADRGFVLSETDDTKKTYKKEDGKTITKTKWGHVRYHVPLSKEEVTELVAKREGKPVDDFTKAVADITEKQAVMESEVAR